MASNSTATQYRREFPLQGRQPVQEWSDQQEQARHAALLRHEWI